MSEVYQCKHSFMVHYEIKSSSSSSSSTSPPPPPPPPPSSSSLLLLLLLYWIVTTDLLLPPFHYFSANVLTVPIFISDKIKCSPSSKINKVVTKARREISTKNKSTHIFIVVLFDWTKPCSGVFVNPSAVISVINPPFGGLLFEAPLRKGGLFKRESLKKREGLIYLSIKWYDNFA